MLTDRGLQRGELLLEHLDDKWRQAFRRLVEEQDLGVHHHRAGDGEHVLLAAAQRARPLVSPVRRALTGAAPVSCSASMRGGCTRIRLRLSPRCHQRFDGWLRRERISSGKSANYLSTQNPWASMPSATLNLLRKFSSAIAAVSSTICASLKWRRSRPWSSSVKVYLRVGSSPGSWISRTRGTVELYLPHLRRSRCSSAGSVSRRTLPTTSWLRAETLSSVSAAVCQGG